MRQGDETIRSVGHENTKTHIPNIAVVNHGTDGKSCAAILPHEFSRIRCREIFNVQSAWLIHLKYLVGSECRRTTVDMKRARSFHGQRILANIQPMNVLELGVPVHMNAVGSGCAQNPKFQKRDFQLGRRPLPCLYTPQGKMSQSAQLSPQRRLVRPGGPVTVWTAYSVVFSLAPMYAPALKRSPASDRQSRY